MNSDSTPSMVFPESGFYHHYKHDPNGLEENYAYEVLGIAQDTETETFGVLYRPLYKSEYLKADYFIRPLEMFNGTVSRVGKEVPRFTRITDPELIERLAQLRNWMYS